MHLRTSTISCHCYDFCVKHCYKRMAKPFSVDHPALWSAFLGSTSWYEPCLLLPGSTDRHTSSVLDTIRSHPRRGMNGRDTFPVPLGCCSKRRNSLHAPWKTSCACSFWFRFCPMWSLACLLSQPMRYAYRWEAGSPSLPVATLTLRSRVAVVVGCCEPASLHRNRCHCGWNPVVLRLYHVCCAQTVPAPFLWGRWSIRRRTTSVHSTRIP